MKNKFNISINYSTNFNPDFFKKYNNFKNKNKNKIFCRNFFLFFMSLNFLNNKVNFEKCIIFVKPKKTFFINILKAPYKNKLFKDQLGFSKYFLILKISCFLYFYKINSFNQFFFFFYNFYNFFLFIESNIINNYKILFTFNFNFFNFFNFKNKLLK